MIVRSQSVGRSVGRSVQQMRQAVVKVRVSRQLQQSFPKSSMNHRYFFSSQERAKTRPFQMRRRRTLLRSPLFAVPRLQVSLIASDASLCSFDSSLPTPAPKKHPTQSIRRMIAWPGRIFDCSGSPTCSNQVPNHIHPLSAMDTVRFAR
jgi:hypothetical protein